MHFLPNQQGDRSRSRRNQQEAALWTEVLAGRREETSGAGCCFKGGQGLPLPKIKTKLEGWTVWKQLPLPTTFSNRKEAKRGYKEESRLSLMWDSPAQAHTHWGKFCLDVRLVFSLSARLAHPWFWEKEKVRIGWLPDTWANTMHPNHAFFTKSWQWKRELQVSEVIVSKN